MERIRVLIADDYSPFLQMLRHFLAAEPLFDLVGEAHSGPEVIAKAQKLEPDMIMMDVGLPGLPGIEALRIIKMRSCVFVLVVLASILLLIFTACGDWRVASREALAREQLKPEVLKGGWLYVEYACVQCHGSGGRSSGSFQPFGISLTSTEFKRAFPKDANFDQALVNKIKNGSIIEDDRAASMPAWNGILAETEMFYIVDYIRAGLPDVSAPIPPARTGEQIYRAFACVKCHGPLGTGGIKNVGATTPEHRVIPPLGGEGFKKKFASIEAVRKVVLNGKLVEDGRPGVVYAPAWGRIGTAEQIERVIGYLYSY